MLAATAGGSLWMKGGVMRRSLVVVCAVAVVVAGAASAVSARGTGRATDPGCTPDGWPQPRQSSCANSSTTDAKAPSVKDVGRLRLAWAYGARAPVGNPIVVDGVVYFVSVGRRATSRMRAVDLASGRKIWNGKAYRDLSASPIADGGVVLGFYGGSLIRYEPSSGRVIWSGRGTEGLLGGVQPDPVMADGNLYWSAGDHVVALDAGTGDVSWARYLECFSCWIAASNGRVYAAGNLVESADGDVVPTAVYAFDARSGATIWSTRTQAESVILADDRVIAVTRSQQGDTWAHFIEAFRAADGERLWQTSVGTIDTLTSTPPAANGTLVVYPSPDGNLYALDTDNGSLRWKVRIGTTDRRVARAYSTPAIANGVVWIVTVDGSKARLTAFDARSGRQVWRSAPFNRVDALRRDPSPVVAGGFVLVGTNGGRILAYHVAK